MRFAAHCQVYTELGILHRDIGANNIIIDEYGRGLLIDWELCRPVQQLRHGQYTRVVSPTNAFPASCHH